MNRRKAGSLVISFFLFLLLSIRASADISLGIYPWDKTKNTYDRFKPMAEAISQALGTRVKLVLAKDHQAFWRDLQGGKFDIILLAQYQYLKIVKSLPYTLLAAAEQQTNKEDRSVLVVSSESKIRSIRDIKGNQLILLKDPRAFSGYLAPLHMMKSAGLKQNKDYTVLYSPDEYTSLNKISQSNNTVAGISESKLKQLMHANSVFATRIHMLATSPTYPTFHVWACKSTLTAEVQQGLNNYFAGFSVSTDAVTPGQRADYARIYPISPKDLAATAQVLGSK